MLRGVTHFFRRVSSVPKLAPSKPFHSPQSFSTQCSSVSRLLFATLPTANPRNSHGMSSRQDPVSTANGEIEPLALPRGIPLKVKNSLSKEVREHYCRRLILSKFSNLRTTMRLLGTPADPVYPDRRIWLILAVYDSSHLGHARFISDLTVLI